jgi:hypothetical protein
MPSDINSDVDVPMITALDYAGSAEFEFGWGLLRF